MAVVKIEKAIGTKKCVLKRKTKFENYKNCLEATQLVKKINYLEKNEINIYSIKKEFKEFIKNNKLILNAQQRFKNDRHNVFTEDVNEITLSLNDDKIMRSVDSIETYTYGTNKDLVSEEEDIKSSNIIKRYKNGWLWYKRKHKRT